MNNSLDFQRPYHIIDIDLKNLSCGLPHTGDTLNRWITSDDELFDVLYRFLYHFIRICNSVFIGLGLATNSIQNFHKPYPPRYLAKKSILFLRFTVN